MTEQAKVPAIRFAGFTDPWEQRKFSELASLRRGLTYSPADIRPYGQGIRVLRSSNIDEDEFTLSNEDVFVDETVVGIELVQEGEILITAANGSPRLVGKRAIINGLTGKTVHGGFMLCAHAEQPDYVAALMGSRWYQHFLATGVAGGNGSIGNLDKAALEDEFAFVPSIEEQELIGVLFSRLDDLITLHQRKYDKLVVFKKSMLEKMFPKDGESVPEIRFAGFTDPWEQRKLGDVASSFDYGLNAAATEYDGQNKYLRITDIDDETHEFSKSDLTTPLADLAMSADYLLKESDLLFARTGASVGKTYLYRQFDGMVYFAGFLIRARIGEGADPEFAYQATLTDAYKKYVAITSQRSGQPGVNAQEYADYQLMLPSKTEQQQIGMTLRSLDDLITLHQRKLELLQNIKKSLLDKMFV